MKTPFEAVAIRYVHDGRNGEFLNIGVVVFAPRQQFAGSRFLQTWGRISQTFPGADAVVLRRIAKAIDASIAEWSAATGDLQFDSVSGAEALVRRVLHGDDSSVQVSPVISGITADPQRTLSELFELYASPQKEAARPASREDSEVWKQFVQSQLQDVALLRRIERKHVLTQKHYELAFDNSWKNGRWNVAQPLSLDLRDGDQVREKAVKWSGRVLTVRPADLDTEMFLLVGMPGKDSTKEVRTAAADALAILRENVAGQAEVLTEDEGEKLAQKIASDLAQHPSDN